MNIGILTISDRGSRGEYEDRSGPLIAQIMAEKTDWPLSHQAVIPDDLDTIVQTLMQWCDAGVSLILTSGGTGFAPRDVTPEATKQVIQRETPGIPEAMRAESLKITKHAMLSRATAGIRGKTLIVNLPGSPKAVRENLAVLLPVLPHALALISESPNTETQHRSV